MSEILQISFSSIVFPALLAAYSGQAAYLRKFPDHVGNTFYDSVPGISIIMFTITFLFIFNKVVFQM